ncbi:HAD hydrolase-like protein, partial [Saccharothrix sp. MB29]|nr:HAD hydrolase-like protein [Saccharothrix sp. MB29]
RARGDRDVEAAERAEPGDRVVEVGVHQRPVDVEASKPAPDLIEVALGRVGGDGRAVVVGDSVWDCEAARRAGLPVVCLRTGGFGEAELREAGASAVYEELDRLRADLTDLPMA